MKGVGLSGAGKNQGVTVPATLEGALLGLLVGRLGVFGAV